MREEHRLRQFENSVLRRIFTFMTVKINNGRVNNYFNKSTDLAY